MVFTTLEDSRDDAISEKQPAAYAPLTDALASFISKDHIACPFHDTRNPAFGPDNAVVHHLT